MEQLSPLFGADEVPVVVTLNKAYIPYFAVMVQSLFGKRDPSRRYEVLVFSLDIEEGDLEEVRAFTACDGFAIRLVRIDEHRQELERIVPQESFTLETFFRLVAPYMLVGFEKVVYLDCDLVVLEDVGELYDTDLGDCLLAAAIDVGMAGMVGGYLPGERERLTGLGIEDPENYFSAGVLVWSLEAFRREFQAHDLFAYAIEKTPRYGDQDTLNYFCQGRVRYLDQRWNTLFDSEGIRVSQIVPFAPNDLQEEYRRARLDPAIFHYAGPIKPWRDRVDGSWLFWREARQSARYEEVLKNWLYSQDGGWFDRMGRELAEAQSEVAGLRCRLEQAEQRIAQAETTIDYERRLSFTKQIYRRFRQILHLQ